MQLAVEALDVGVADADLEAVRREVSERFTTSLFAGVRDLRLRLRSAKGALLCVAVDVTSSPPAKPTTATSNTPLTAMVGALDGLPARMDRLHRADTAAPAPSLDHAAVRAELKRLLDRA